MLQQNVESNIEMNTIESSFDMKTEEIIESIESNDRNEIQTSPIIPKSSDGHHEKTIETVETPPILGISCTAMTTQAASSMDDMSEHDMIESPIKSVEPVQSAFTDESNMLIKAISPVEPTTVPLIEHSPNDGLPNLVSPTTPTVPKERKRRIIIDDDDESPTFNPLRSNKKIRGKNRRNRHNSMLKKQKKTQLLSTSLSSFVVKTNENAVFTSPEVVVSNSSSYHYYQKNTVIIKKYILYHFTSFLIPLFSYVS